MLCRFYTFIQRTCWSMSRPKTVESPEVVPVSISKLCQIKSTIANSILHLFRSISRATMNYDLFDKPLLKHKLQMFCIIFVGCWLLQRYPGCRNHKSYLGTRNLGFRRKFQHRLQGRIDWRCCKGHPWPAADWHWGLRTGRAQCLRQHAG